MTNSYQTVESERLIGGSGPESKPVEDVKSLSKWKVAAIACAVAMLFVGAVAWSEPRGSKGLFRGLFVSTVPLQGINSVFPGDTVNFQIPHAGIWQIIVEGNAGYGVGEGNAYFRHIWDDNNPGVEFRTIQGPEADGRPVMYVIVGGNYDVLSVHHNFQYPIAFSATTVSSVPEATIETNKVGQYPAWEGDVKASDQLSWSAMGMEKGSAHVLKCNIYQNNVIGVVADYLRDVPNQQRANVGVWDIKDMHCYVWSLGPEHVTGGGYGPPAFY